MNKPKVLPTELDIKQTTAVTCDACGNDAFQSAIMLRRVSALMTGTGESGFRSWFRPN